MKEDCKRGQHNEKLWRDGFTKAILVGVLTYSLYLSTVFDTDLHVII
jgi:hypothetical protein